MVAQGSRCLKTVAAIGILFVHAVSAHMITSAAAPGPATATTCVWMTDLQAAHEKSQQTGRSLLIQFTAPWSTPCRLAENQLQSDPQLTRLLTERFVLVQLDFDRDRRIADILVVREIPSLVILSPAGDLLGRCNGLIPAEKLSRSLEQAERFRRQLEQPGESANPEHNE